MNNIRKSKDNAVIFGVLGGLGEYFNVDPVLLRVLVVVVTFLTAGFPIILAYLILALVIPEESRNDVEQKRKNKRSPFSDKTFRGNSRSRRGRKEAEDVEVEDKEDDDWSDF